MYEYLRGILVKITPTSIVLDVSGIGYLLSVANPYNWSDKINQETQIFVHQIVREDSETLYGFTDLSEKNLFLKLISVSGIGPKSALAIIAADDNVGLVNAIDNSDIKYLTKFPGVGKKTAMQIALDLAGKFTPESLSNLTEKVAGNGELDEAMEALTALGYRATELKKIEKQLSAEAGKSAQDYIKLALKLMMK